MIKPEDHVLQNDLRFFKENLELQ